jgi:hypothetical protein
MEQAEDEGRSLQEVALEKYGVSHLKHIKMFKEPSI